MSIHDRDYYRQSFDPNWGRSPHARFNAMSGRITPVVKWLLIINVGVYLLSLVLERVGVPFFQHPAIYNPMGRAIALEPSPFEHFFGLFPPYLFTYFAFWQFITYQFLHGGVLHLAFNMFALFMVGRYVERQIGSRSFLRLYLIGGVFAGLVNLLVQLFVSAPTIGASGSVCAVLAAFGLMNPHARLVLFIFFFPVTIKARTFVIVYALWTALMAIGAQDGVAHLAHLGGLVMGWMYVYNILRVRRLIDGGHSRGAPQGDWRARLHRAWLAATGRAPRVFKGQEYEEADFREKPGQGKGKWNPRIDEILDKMSREGVHSLTDEEWEILGKYRGR
jgi:membrane associated rhomboid family serine protease